MKRLILCMMMTMTLSGCLGNISFDGLASTGGATACATGGAMISPETALIGGLICGVATDAATAAPTADPKDFAGADGELSFVELLAFMWSNFTSHIMTVGIVAGILWILTGYLGLRMKRPEEKRAEQQAEKLLEKLMER